MNIAPYKFRKKCVAVIGASGQIGTPLTRELLNLGHNVVCITRKAKPDWDKKLLEYQEKGACIVSVPDMTLIDDMASALQGSDTLICAVPATPKTIKKYEPIWLEAAIKAEVSRFVPTEFGAHTKAIEMGDGAIFDSKKELHKKIFVSGIDWTFFYNGLIFDYCLPNLRFFHKITTFGDLKLPIYTHDIRDIGKIAAIALTDDRTINKCVQIDYIAMSQEKMIQLLKQNFPEHTFDYIHYSSEYIIDQKDHASDEITAKKGAETDRERWGVNYICYVKGKLAAFTEETLRTTDLYPKYQLIRTPEIALKDPTFVLGK